MEGNPFKNKKSYSIEEKIFILNLLNNGQSKHSIENEFGISRKALRDWEKQNVELLKMDH